MVEKFPYAARALLEDDWRRRNLDPDRFWRRVGLRTGQTVVDVGAGTGYFALPAARRVGFDGRVYACDVSAEMVAHVARAAAGVGLDQLEALRSTEHRLPLAAGIADLVLAAFVLHEVEEPTRLLADIRRVLKPTGRLVVLDWLPDAPEPPNLPRRMRWEPATVRTLLRQAHLRPVHTSRPNAANYLIEAYGAGAAASDAT